MVLQIGDVQLAACHRQCIVEADHGFHQKKCRAYLAMFSVCFYNNIVESYVEPTIWLSDLWEINVHKV